MDERLLLLEAWDMFCDQTGLGHIRFDDLILDRQREWEHLEYLLDHEQVTYDSKALTAEEYEKLEGASMIQQMTAPKGIDYKALKARIDILQYIERFTGPLRKTGGTRFVGKCPLPGHTEKTGSFTVYTENQSFYCYGCGTGGDVITFAKLMGVGAEQLNER